MSEQLSARFDLLRDWLHLANNRAEAEVALRRFASAHGFEWFTYLSLAGANSYGISNYAPDWQEDYLLKNKAAVDPVIEASLRNRGSFSWSEDEWPFRLTKQHRKFLGEARAYGIKSGVSIPIVSAYGRRALFTFASREARADQYLVNHQHSVATVGVFIDGYLLGRQADRWMRAAPCPLTMKQRECLAWRAEGKKNQDIATMRGVSLRAIEDVLKGARSRLGVETTDHAMAVAMRRQWI